ncbi:peptidase M76 [Piptocephalis cylindrospora]|uniref:Mitochondrial inner membrane protease ATP23 n=1 Tax=Piptocephalis cylindrospora TaxID=1907219 RepID=A0A4P9Y0Y2_9FUNG|nr:peptidase M76 [Piptocephalis cylindrospora]|eukprot:RKP12408.1 peptidase M76 [Piptocephalis cylindrospora]
MLTEKEKKVHEQLSEIEMAERDRKTCEKWKKQFLERSPMVRFMMAELSKAGCPFESRHLRCLPCDLTRSGGFGPKEGIALCQNRFINKTHMEDTLSHELIHAYDHCRFKVQWNDIKHHACSEIRAANLSGDCKWTRELRRGNISFVKQHQACVKRRAILSVKQSPSCPSEEDAVAAVAEVFDSCFTDTRPFDDIY